MSARYWRSPALISDFPTPAHDRKNGTNDWWFLYLAVIQELACRTRIRLPASAACQRYLASEQRILGEVDLGREVGGATAVGMHLLHQSPMGLDNLFLVGVS